MIRAIVMYPNGADARFDHEYYLTRHLPFVTEKLRPRGMIRAEVDRGLAAGDGGAPPLVAAMHIFFPSAEAFQKAMGEVGAELIADVPNYTNIALQIQIAEVIDTD